MTDRLPDTLTATQVADLLHMTPLTVWAMARQGRLPAHRPEGQKEYVFYTAEVMDWLRAHPASPNSVD